jgi:[protein-PII] uridylyltransferase
VQYLVQNHVVMGQTARLRDLNDQSTVDEFTRTVPSPELLDMLYLLTAADLASVGQSNWNEVQMRFLRELYHRAGTALRRKGTSTVDIERHRSRLTRELSLTNLPEAEVEEHCRAMPASYLLNTSPDDLAAHILLVRQARSGSPIVSAKDDPTGRLTEITVCVLDDPKPGLLAKIAGAFHALGVDIHAAQVFTRESTDRIAIDTLYVDADQHPLPELKRLQAKSELEALLAGKTDLCSLFRRFGRKPGGCVYSPYIQVMSHVSDRHSVVQVEADDQVGLLYLLTSCISSLGWNIHSARINTWGNKAQDAFYVTDGRGYKLDPDMARTELGKALQIHKPERQA